MRTRIVWRARGGPVDRAEYGLMAADENHIAGEVERGRWIVMVDGRRDEVGDRCKTDLASLALRKLEPREGE